MTSFVRKQQEMGYAKYPNEDEVMAARDVLKPPGIMSNVSLEDFTPCDDAPHMHRTFHERFVSYQFGNVFLIF